MTQTPTMDPNFADTNRRAIARAIHKELLERLLALNQTLTSADFEADFYGEPGTPLVDALISFNTFFDDVVVQGWTQMKTTVDTPDEINGAYTYLASKGVEFDT